MKEAAANRSKGLIRSLDQAFEKLEQELSRAALLVPSVPDELEVIRKGLLDAYTKALKAAALQDDEGAAGSLVSVQEVLLSEGSKSDSSYFC